nr:MAG: nonstructural protein [Microvirus sp.]
MKTLVYVIYDKVAEDSGPMFEAVNDGVALRQAVNILKPLPPLFRDEYKLVCLGEYNPSTMEIQRFLPPREIDFTIALARLSEEEK